MNIVKRMNHPDIEGREISNGLSLLRWSHDTALLGRCAALQSACPGMKLRSNVNGLNRIAMHVLASEEIRQNSKLLGNISVRELLQQVVANAPTVADPLATTVKNVAIDGRYLYADLSDLSIEKLETESEAILDAIEGLNPQKSDQFEWTDLPSYIEIGLLPAQITPTAADKIEQIVHNIFKPPFDMELSPVECTLPGLGRYANRQT